MSDSTFVVCVSGTAEIEVAEDAYPDDNVPREIANANAEAILKAAIEDGKAEVTVELERGDSARWENRNQFWQVHDCLPGCLPDSRSVLFAREDAERELEHRMDDYVADGWDVIDDGDDYVTVEHGQTERTLSIRGPMTYEDMGYDSLTQCLPSNSVNRSRYSYD